MSEISSDSGSEGYRKSSTGRGVKRPAESGNDSDEARTTLDDLVQREVEKALRTRKRKISPNVELIPLFDPERMKSTKSWLNKIDQIGKVHGWDDTTMSYCMQARLSGIAKVWYENLDNYALLWPQWKEALLQAFPSNENYVDTLKQMLGYKKLHSESMAHYFYYKNMLVHKCGITEKNAVSCIIDGLPLGLQANARAGNFNTPERLFSEFLSKLETIQTATSSSKGEVGESRSVSQLKPKLCFGCNKPGHVKKDCRAFRKPFWRESCEVCRKTGHTKERCWYKNQKAVQCLTRQVNPLYYVTVVLNNLSLQGYLDTGSEINVLHVSVASKLGLKLNTCNMVLRPFGGGIIIPSGICTVELIINNFCFETSVVIIDAEMGSIDIIIGQPIINHERSQLVITGDQITLTQVTKPEWPESLNDDQRLVLKTMKEEKIPAGCTSRILVEVPGFQFPVVLHSKCHVWEKEQYTIPTTLIEGPVSTITVTNLGAIPTIWEAGRILGRVDRISVREYLSPNNNMTITANNSINAATTLPEYFINAINVDHIHVGDLNVSEKKLLNKLLQEYDNCFASCTNELGLTNLTEFEINFNSTEPVFYKPYRLSEYEKGVVRDILGELLEGGIIRESNSCYASPVILVKKPNGKHRLCVDFRKLNSVTIKDRYPLPHIEDQINKLKGSRYFCSLDMAQGYYQIPVEEGSIHKTAFITSEGQYEFLRMPFGVCNAPATFQRLIHQVLGNLRHEKVLVYLDDILIPSKTVLEGVTILEEVLKLFQKANLKFNIDKCFFFKTQIEYLGYDINENGVRPSGKKTDAVMKYKAPGNVHELRQFLGLVSYFRKFVCNFAKITAPLSTLLRKDSTWKWGPNEESAFKRIKEILTTRPVLKIYNPEAQTEVHTDASSKGIAGILLQWQENQLHPISYYSRTTTREESLYHSYELETLAVVDSIKRFRIYLVGTHFKVVTDCSAVRSTFTKKDIVPRIARWWFSIQDFDMEVIHRQGDRMKHVDALSRNAIVNAITFSVEDWILTAQMQDNRIRIIYEKLKKGIDDSDIRNNYIIKDNRVCRKVNNGETRVVIPKLSRFSLLRRYHDDIGHIGLKRCETLIKSTYWFEKMTTFIRKYINACLDCQFKKAQYGRREGFLHPIDKPEKPMHTWHVDHLGPFCKSKQGFAYIIMIIDSFSKYLFCRKTRTTNSKEMCENLKDLFSLFGVPKRLISDNGKCFISKDFQNFCLQYQVKHVLTAVASPRSNGQIERYNRTLLDAINTSIEDEKDWNNILPDIVWGMNNTVNSSTGFTPHKLMFGLENIRLDSPDKQDTSAAIHKKAKQKMDKVSNRMKKNFDKKRKRGTVYAKNDLVLWADAPVTCKDVNRKLGVKYGGPYKINKVLGNDRYEIVPLKATKGYKKFKAVVAIDKLRKYGNNESSSGSDDSEVDSTEELIDLLEG